MAGSGRKVWAADEVLAAADLQDYIQDQTVMRFASSAARASGILSPTEGMVTYLDDANALFVYDGSAWVAVVADGSINTAKLAIGAVTTDRIANSAVDVNKIADGNVTNAKLASGIDAAKVTTGTLPIDQVPTIPSSKLGTGNWNMGAATLTTTNVTASGVISAGDFTAGAGTLTANGGLVSTDVYNRNLSGPYRAVWVDSSGRIGNTSSSIKIKQDVVDADVSADAVSALRLVEFRYRQAVEAEGAEAMTHIGLIAEEVAAIPGMEKFVFYGDDGEVQGVHYELLSLALIPIIQKQEERLAALEARLGVN